MARWCASRDIARVDLGAKTQERHSRFNGAPLAAIGIYQSPGANAVDVARHVRDVMEDLKQRFPDDLTYEVFFDNTVFVTSTVAEVVARSCWWPSSCFCFSASYVRR